MNNIGLAVAPARTAPISWVRITRWLFFIVAFFPSPIQHRVLGQTTSRTDSTLADTGLTCNGVHFKHSILDSVGLNGHPYLNHSESVLLSSWFAPVLRTNIPQGGFRAKVDFYEGSSLTQIDKQQFFELLIRSRCKVELNVIDGTYCSAPPSLPEKATLHFVMWREPVPTKRKRSKQVRKLMALRR